MPGRALSTSTSLIFAQKRPVRESIAKPAMPLMRLLPTHIQLVVAESQDHWRQARQFLEEYAASLGVDLSFQNFDHELVHLSSEYAAPRGVFFLAEAEGTSVGCIGLRHFAEGVGEIKRLY